MLNRGIADIKIASNQQTAINNLVKSICSRRTLNGNIITNNLSSVITAHRFGGTQKTLKKKRTF